MKIGVIVGRFQTPILHAGHLNLIGTALQECDYVIIFLGVSTIHNDSRNPYSVSEREATIRKVFPQTEHFFNITDEECDKSWSKNLDEMIGYLGEDDIVLYHSRDSFKEVYSGKYPLREIPEIPGYSATAIREALKKNKDENIL